MKSKLICFIYYLLILQITSSTLVLDFINYDSEITWDNIKTDSVESVILKIAEGFTIDKYFQTNLQTIQNKDIDIGGVYFLSKSESENQSIAEVDFLIASLKGQKYPIYLDLETNNTSNLGIKEITKIMIAFTKRCLTYEYECNIYTSKKGFFTYFYPGQLADLGSKFWVTSYNNSTNEEQINIKYKPNVGELMWRYYKKEIQPETSFIGYNMKYNIEMSKPSVNMTRLRKMVKVIHPNGVPIRKTPVIDIYNIVKVSTYGERIQIVDHTEDAKWYIDSNGYYVTTDVKYVIDSKGVANKQPVSIKQNPLGDATEVTSVYFGTVLPVIEENPDWVKVCDLSGKEGWALKDDVTFK